MAYIVKMPKLGLEMDQGTVVKWHVSEGDAVERDQVIADIESEKTTAEIDAREGGVLRRIGVSEGETVKPGASLAIVADADEDISVLEDELDGGGAGGGSEVSAEAVESATASEAETAPAEATSASRATSGEVKAVPRARKRAEELGVDLATVEGTGPQGAVVEEDVERAAEGGAGETAPSEVKAVPRARKRAEELGVDLATVEGTGPQGAIVEEDVERAAEAGEEPAAAAPEGVEERPLTGMRRTIAERLGQSYREAVHVTEHRTANAKALLAAADAVEDQLGIDASVNDVLLVALSAALSEHPEFNATFEDDVHRLHEDHNICVAVDIDAGLVAPVVRGVDSRSLSDLVDERRRVTEKALSGEYTSADLSGGTFTVTNLGVLGVESFDPVINPPQVAILGVNSVTQRAVPDENGEAVFRRVLPLDLSFDHRIVDGADAARFLGTLVDHLENPWPLLEGVDAEAAEGEAEVVLPDRHVSAFAHPDLSGTISAGSFEYEFSGGSEFGDGGAPTPVDYFLSGLAACLSGSIAVQGDIRDVDVDYVDVDVEATPTEGSVESIAITATVATDADEGTVERMVKNGERTCHVAELLREDLSVDLTWERVVPA